MFRHKAILDLNTLWIVAIDLIINQLDPGILANKIGFHCQSAVKLQNLILEVQAVRVMRAALVLC